MKKHLLLVLLQLGASAADGYYTHRNQQLPRHWEANPIARPFVHSPIGLGAYFTAESAAKIYIAAELSRRHHEKLALAASIAGITDNAVGASYSAEHFDLKAKKR
jgi:hypothetical protein